MFDDTSVGLLSDGAYIRKVVSSYTEDQIATYLGRIGWSTPSPSRFVPNLENLSLLMLLHVLAFPIDNTDLH